MLTHSRWAGLLALLLLLSACSPTFNWRELRLPGTPLLALMPCKPESATRPVPLGGATTALHLHSCQADKLHFAVAWADVGGADRVTPALAAWRAASLHSLRAPASTSSAVGWAIQVVGAEAVQGVQASGTDPQGQPVQMQALYFSRGTQVFQAVVYGPALPAEVLDAFFTSLRLHLP